MNLKYLQIFWFCLFLLSCSNFLDEKSQDDVIPKTTTDFSELLMGSGYPDPSNAKSPYAFTALLDDDMQITNNLSNYSYVNSVFPIFTWQSYMYTEEIAVAGLEPSNTTYHVAYERILGCNAVLDNIDDALGSQQERDRVKAEALAIRAFHYFRLVNVYGEPYNYNKQSLGVPLKLNSSIIDVGTPRSTVDEVYSQIVKDLEDAVKLFEKYPVTHRDYHINLPSTYIILSRVYLYMENWEKVVDYSTKAISTGGALQDLTLITEDLFPVLTYNNTETEWAFGGSNVLDNTSFMFSEDLFSEFHLNDKRNGLYVSGNLINKENSSSSTYEPRGAIRTAEAYLNRAEANAQLNELTIANADLNELRKNRVVGYISQEYSNKEELIKQIHRERRLEFCAEAMRWFDLRRYGMPSITHKYQGDVGEPYYTFILEEKDPMYTIPLPNTIMLNNTNLVQNSSINTPERIGN